MEKELNSLSHGSASKVPEVTLMFWIIKIAATTLGETGGDAASMTLKVGYAVASVIFIGIFLAAVSVQIAQSRFHPFTYWFTIVATTTAGTTMADFADRSLGIGYPGGALVLFVLLMISLAIWYGREGSLAVETVASPRVEMFYWVTIMFSQTLGTALGDWMADSAGLGYEGGALVFSAGLLMLVLLHYFTKASSTALFWAAFILTRPLGATVGDFLDKPVDHGGLAISRITASAFLLILMAGFILLFPQRPGRHAGPSLTGLPRAKTT